MESTLDMNCSISKTGDILTAIQLSLLREHPIVAKTARSTKTRFIIPFRILVISILYRHTDDTVRTYLDQ